MAKPPNKPLLEVFQNGTLEEVTEVVDTELKSLGKTYDSSSLIVSRLFQVKLLLMRYLRHQNTRQTLKLIAADYAYATGDFLLQAVK